MGERTSKIVVTSNTNRYLEVTICAQTWGDVHTAELKIAHTRYNLTRCQLIFSLASTGVVDRFAGQSDGAIIRMGVPHVQKHGGVSGRLGFWEDEPYGCVEWCRRCLANYTSEGLDTVMIARHLGLITGQNLRCEKQAAQESGEESCSIHCKLH
jgi:hypothetical protein